MRFGLSLWWTSFHIYRHTCIRTPAPQLLRTGFVSEAEHEATQSSSLVTTLSGSHRASNWGVNDAKKGYHYIPRRLAVRPFQYQKDEQSEPYRQNRNKEAPGTPPHSPPHPLN
jgi:hypothetical protein